MHNAHSLLLEQLARLAYKYDPDNPFTLVSGKTSVEYLDCKRAFSHAKTMALLGKTFTERLKPSIEAVGGLTLGADPIAMSICQFSAETKRHIKWFTVRKEIKAYGQQKHIEGDVFSGTHVAVVDDVITTGQSTIKAINACKKYGLIVDQVIALVDREEQNGIENIKEIINNAYALFTKTEIHQKWEYLKVQ